MVLGKSFRNLGGHLVNDLIELQLLHRHSVGSVAGPKTKALSLDHATLLAYKLLTPPKVNAAWVGIPLESPVSLMKFVCFTRQVSAAKGAQAILPSRGQTEGFFEIIIEYQRI